jgi:hypothetical protein
MTKTMAANIQAVEHSTAALEAFAMSLTGDDTQDSPEAVTVASRAV